MTELRLEVTDEKPEMSFGCFLATEGGRKCPQCGRYAKPSELGYIGWVDSWGSVTMYGHLPGFGCNTPASSSTEEQRLSKPQDEGSIPFSPTITTMQRGEMTRSVTMPPRLQTTARRWIRALGRETSGRGAKRLGRPNAGRRLGTVVRTDRGSGGRTRHRHS